MSSSFSKNKGGSPSKAEAQNNETEKGEEQPLKVTSQEKL